MIRQANQFRELLIMIGLSEKEINICVHLFMHGPSFPSIIARTIELPRTTVQHLLTDLARRNIVETSKQKLYTFYRIATPDNIFRTLENRYERIASRMREFRQILKSASGKQRVH